jgi:rubrerythrin
MPTSNATNGHLSASANGQAARSAPQLIVPASGFDRPPAIEQPNIFPLEWPVATPSLAALYEKSKVQAWNPSDLAWNDLDPVQFTPEERLGIMYWYAVLAVFDGSGPAVFSKAMIHTYEIHAEDPIRKCFFSVARDEVNHEECCQHVIERVMPNGPLRFGARTELERAAVNNIEWLYHNGGRYWRGYSASLDKYPLSVLFTSFLLGEVAASTLFYGMSQRTSRPVFKQIFTKVGQDESRHLAICLKMLENDWPGLSDDYKAMITRQLRAGFVFLSMILWEPPNLFWELPSYFIENHRVLVDLARQGGLGVLSFDEQADNWRYAIAKVKKVVEDWGIKFPAIPELDLDGVDVGNITAADIIPVF